MAAVAAATAAKAGEYKLYKTRTRPGNNYVFTNSPDGQQQIRPLKSTFSSSFYVLVRAGDAEMDSLWFDRTTGELQLKKIANCDDLELVHAVHGFIGKFQLNSNCHPKLAFVKEAEHVGTLHAKSNQHDVFKLKQISIVTLSPDSSATLGDDTDSVVSMELDNAAAVATAPAAAPPESNFLSNLLTAQPFKSPTVADPKPLATAASSSPNLLTVPTGQGSASAAATPGSPNGNSSMARVERKILEEVQRLFQENGGGSFYYSHTFDLTNSVERQEELFYSIKTTSDAEQDESPTKPSLPTSFGRPDWRKAHERFFWNRVMLSELIDLDADPANRDTIDSFVLPLLQGFVQLETFRIKLIGFPFQAAAKSSSKHKTSPKQLSPSGSCDDEFADLRLALIARRSRYRLGTRFKRRGIDDNGHVANFVETEQIVNVYGGHTLSFVIVRGSIPLYWSQSGVKYRPAPRIDRTASENKAAFRKHFEDLGSSYPSQKQIVVVNLVEEAGKESLLGNAYLENLAELDQENVTYVQFDFHEHCKGLKFENVSVLVDKINELISDNAYCWVDKRGVIFKQKHLFRVNCVDCLDRTNVVQMVIAKNALENQLGKLGLLVPSESRSVDLPVEFKKKFLSLWANMGDAISLQYAGTSALKGDYTRTGERNLAGIMKDGVTSANRYYLRFRDNYRQLAIDVLQGVKLTDEELLVQTASSSGSSASQLKPQQTQSTDEQKPREESSLDEVALISQTEREENVKQLVADCRKQLIDVSEDCYGSWALINYTESSDANQIDPDVVLLFTSSALYISNYDDSSETFVDYQKIYLQDIEKFELGPEPVSSQSLFFKNSPAPRFHILRIHYRIPPSAVLEQPTSSASSSALSSMLVAGESLLSGSDASGYFHTFRSCNLRFFNNLVITTKSPEEMTEALRGICHTIQSTALYFNHNIEFEESSKMSKKKSKVPNNLIKLSKLRTRLSIVSQPKLGGKGVESSTSKLNKFGKMIGSKILDLTGKKAPVPKPTPIEPSINSAALESSELSKGDFDKSLFYLDDAKAAPGKDADESQEQQTLTEELAVVARSVPAASAEPAELSVGQGLVSLVGSLIPTQLVASAKPGGYIPKLSQREFPNRQERQSQINKLVQDCKQTKFIFI